MKVSQITNYLSSRVPVSLQEDYDNSGLQVGDEASEISSVLLSVDVTEEIVDEAIKEGAGLIITHHPLIFKGLRSITGRNYIERVIRKAIKNDIAIYSAHTNLDVFRGGVSYMMAQKIGLRNVSALTEIKRRLLKIAVFVPEKNIEQVRMAMFDAGAGSIGEYDHCSFSTRGEGSFRAGEGTNPYAGEIGRDHFEKEVRIEVIVPDYSESAVVSAMIKSHPYEEVAYDIYRLENALPGAGLGCIGDLDKRVDASKFLNDIATVFEAKGVRYSGNVNSTVKKVALCGGSGSSLIKDALWKGADIFITADIKYHSFFEGNDKMIIADIGHYESEKSSLEILYELITKKFPKFAVRFSKNNTNPINYL